MRCRLLSFWGPIFDECMTPIWEEGSAGARYMQTRFHGPKVTFVDDRYLRPMVSPEGRDEIGYFLQILFEDLPSNTNRRCQCTMWA
jgi:hypothetical protein